MYAASDEYGAAIVQHDLINPSYSMGVFNSDGCQCLSCTLYLQSYVQSYAELPKNFCLGLLLLTVACQHLLKGCWRQDAMRMH